jgi:Zn2+/Cd2+-exporting ATPase
MSGATTSTCALCEVHAESVFRVEGMDCHEEVSILERRLKYLPGFEDLSADVIGRRLRIKHDAARLSATAISQAVAETGMRAWLEHERPDIRVGASARQRLVILSGIALGAGMALRLLDAGPALFVPFFVTAIVAGGIHTARRAFTAVRMLSLDIHVLMLVAVAGAMAIGEWTEAATVVFLFALAQLLEVRSMDRARHAISALVELAPREALVRRGGADLLLAVEQVDIGETVIVRPGEKIPLDGRVVAGHSLVDQAPITGESLPVDKENGDEVYAGTINGRGSLEVSVTRRVRDTTLARIVNLVEHAQAQRAPSQAFVERFARYYTPSVIALAAVVVIAPPLFFGEPFRDWLYQGLVLLVIACPCALVISTPVSIVSALAAAARKGVLIKGGLHLERTGAVRCVAFDKTGTLTKGMPEVVDVYPLNGLPRREVLRLAASLEARSEHPLGRAIVRYASAEGLAIAAGDSFQALPGLGAAGRVDGTLVIVGSHRLFAQRGLWSEEADERLDDALRSGRTAVVVAREDELVGIIALADRTRESGRHAVELLRRQGVRCVAMLTGDNVGTARAIAAELGVDEFHAELLPEDKVAAVLRLRSDHGAVAMVGDGVNDAPALAAADVGIAMGTVGTDVALETADVALMSDELLKIPYTVRLGSATVRNIKTNISISLGLKAAFLGLALTGVATLWMAVVADMGASLLVIANGLRLLRVH